MRSLLLLGMLSSFAFGEPLSMARLRSEYDNLTSLTADIEQTKTTPKLRRPLQSSIRLVSDKGVVHWNVLKPAPASIVFDDTGITIDSGGQTKRMSAASSPQLGELFQFIRSLALGDFGSLENDFTLTIDSQTLTAKPKPTSKIPFIKEFTLKFNSQMILEHMRIAAQDEVTELHFSNVKLQRNTPNTSTSPS